MGFVEVRNALAHGLGRLTDRQLGKYRGEVLPQIAAAGVRLDGDLVPFSALVQGYSFALVVISGHGKGISRWARMVRWVGERVEDGSVGGVGEVQVGEGGEDAAAGGFGGAAFAE